MPWSPTLTRAFEGSRLARITVGHPMVDDYLVFVGARLRLNSWVSVAYDLKVFFSIVGKEPAAVTPTDVFVFIKAQRAPRRGPKVVRLEDGEAGLSARTIKRRLASVSGFYAYLVARGDAGVKVEPGASRQRDPTARAGGRVEDAVDPHAAHPASGAVALRGRGVHGSVAQPP